METRGERLQELETLIAASPRLRNARPTPLQPLPAERSGLHVRLYGKHTWAVATVTAEMAIEEFAAHIRASGAEKVILLRIRNAGRNVLIVPVLEGPAGFTDLDGNALSIQPQQDTPSREVIRSHHKESKPPAAS